MSDQSKEDQNAARLVPIITEWTEDADGHFICGDAEAWREAKRERDFDRNWS